MNKKSNNFMKKKYVFALTISFLGFLPLSAEVFATDLIQQKGDILYGEAISNTLSRTQGQNNITSANFGKIISYGSYYKPANKKELKEYLDSVFAAKESYYLLDLDKNLFPEEYKNGTIEINDNNRDSVYTLSNLQWSYYPEKTTNSLRVVIVPIYFESEGRLISRDAFVDNLADEINSLYTTEFEKVYALYSYIIRHTSYDYGTPIQTNSYSDNVEAAFASTLILKQRAVCQGYAELFSLVADKLGIDNRVATGEITSSSSGNTYHAWNKVKVDGKWYNLDATWGDYNYYLNGNIETLGLNKRIGYFLFSDKVASYSRVFESSTLPAATSEKYDIFYNIVGDYGIDSGLYKGKIATATPNGFEIYDSTTLQLVESMNTNPNTISIINGVIYHQLWNDTNTVYAYDMDTNENTVFIKGYKFLGVNKDGVHVENNVTKKREVQNFFRYEGFDTTIFKIGVEKNSDKLYKNVIEFNNMKNSDYSYKQYSKEKVAIAKTMSLKTNLTFNDVPLVDTKPSWVLKGSERLNFINKNVALYNTTKGIILPIYTRYLNDADLEIFSRLKLHNTDSYTLIISDKQEYMNNISITTSNFVDFKGTYK